MLSLRSLIQEDNRMEWQARAFSKLHIRQIWQWQWQIWHQTGHPLCKVNMIFSHQLLTNGKHRRKSSRDPSPDSTSASPKRSQIKVAGSLRDQQTIYLVINWLKSWQEVSRATFNVCRKEKVSDLKLSSLLCLMITFLNHANVHHSPHVGRMFT